MQMETAVPRKTGWLWETTLVMYVCFLGLLILKLSVGIAPGPIAVHPKVVSMRLDYLLYHYWFVCYVRTYYECIHCELWLYLSFTGGQGSNFHLWFLHVEKATPAIFIYVALVWWSVQPIFTKPAAICYVTPPSTTGAKWVLLLFYRHAPQLRINE